MCKLKSAVVVVLLAVSLALLADVAAAVCSNVTTFNTGLTPWVGNYWQRRDLISDALAQEGSDVLCLQEVWFEDDMRHVIDDLKGMYPHHFSAIHTGPNKLEGDSNSSSWWAQSACSAAEMGHLSVSIVPCAWSNGCFSDNIEESIACLAHKCAHVLHLDTLGADCISCLVLSSSSVSDVTNRCHKVFGDDLRLNPPGLLLLSKKPLGNSSYQTFFPGRKQLLQRGYIQTQIADVGTVLCTHLSALSPYYLEYDLSFSSYDEHKKAEINAIHDRVGTTEHVLAGDFNQGKEVSSANPEKDLGAEASESFALLEQYGYYKAHQYLDDDGRCTYCDANPLVSNYNLAVDDVLVMGHAFSSVTKQRVLDQTNPVLSDHYGVRARLCTSA